MMTPLATKAMIQIALQGVIDAIKEGGDLGAPAGVLYTALINQMTLVQFEAMMNFLVIEGFIRKRGDLYFFVKDLVS